MKNNKTQMALIVAAALVSMAQAQAETLTLTSQFTPLENLSAQDRNSVQEHVQRENPMAQIDWENSIIGRDESGNIQVRNKNSLKLLAHTEPTCMSQ